MRRCDVALIVLNAEEGVTEQDTKIAGYVHEEGKAAIIVVNKWDAVEKDTYTLEAFRKQVLEDLKFMDYAPGRFYFGPDRPACAQGAGDRQSRL